VGASVMLADPIFKGLAISLMAGEIASLLISRMAVPVLYFMAHRRGSLLEQSHRRNLPLCLPQSDSRHEQKESLPSAPMIPGNRFSLPVIDNETTRDTSDLTTKAHSGTVLIGS